IRMPSRDEGIAAALEIRAWDPPTPVMLLSQHIETRRTVELVAGGAIGYLLKDRVLDVDDFLAALDRVATGGTALDPEVVTRLLGTARASSVLDALTPRELDVLALDGRGLVERRRRAATLPVRAHDRDAHRQHLRQAGTARVP